MFYRTFDLYEEFGADRGGVSGGRLTVYAPAFNHENRPRVRPTALVIPGGAYNGVSTREGEPVVLRLLAAGYAVFLLQYTALTVYPAPLKEAVMAMRFIRAHAAEYYADPDHVAAFGFSAGGHLTGLLATLTEEEMQGDGRARPDAVVLSYPVISMFPPLTHACTARNITGGDGALAERISVEKRVDEKSAPAFIWHTFTDSEVPAENSLLLVSAYRKAGVRCELHCFEEGVHGLSVADAEVTEDPENPAYESVKNWLPLAGIWLKRHGFSIRIG